MYLPCLFLKLKKNPSYSLQYLPGNESKVNNFHKPGLDIFGHLTLTKGSFNDPGDDDHDQELINIQ